MEESNEVGIELLKKFISEGIELGMTIDEQLEDGYQWSDLWSVIGEAKDLLFVVSQWDAIKIEFGNLTDEEILELVKDAVVELGITDEQILTLIDALVDFASSTYELYKAFKVLKK